MRGVAATALVVFILPLFVHANEAPVTKQAQTETSEPVTLAIALDTLHAGEPEAALTGLQSYRGGTKEASSVEVEYALGRAWLTAGYPGQARKALRSVTDSSHILSDYALLHLGQAQLEDGDPEAAQETLKRFLEVEPEGPLTELARLYLANALAAQRKHAEAADLYVQIEADGPEAESREGVLLRAALENEAAGRVDDAVVLHKRIWRDHPGTPEADVAESRLLVLARQGVRDARDYDDFHGRFYRALALHGQGDRDAAIAELNALKKEYPRKISSDFELRRGYVYFRARRYSEARTILERAIRRTRSGRVKAEALFWHARANGRLGNPNTARREYRQLHKLYPRSRWSRKGLYLSGMMTMDTRDYRQAVRDFQYYIDAYPRARDADEALWWQGWCYYRLGWYKSTDIALRRLISRHSRSSLVKQAYYWRARAAQERGQTERAATLFSLVDQRYPQTYYGLLARSRLVQMGRKATTIEHRPVTDEVPDVECPTEERDYYFFLARSEALVKLGFLSEAATELRRARESTSNRGCLLQIAYSALEASDFHTVQYIARNHLGSELTIDALREGDLDMWYLAYPRAYDDVVRERAQHYGFPPSLVWALMREESTFRAEVVSPVGAIGLLQIMPYTGEEIANRLGVEDFEADQLYQPETNIQFSTWYINGLLGRWGGNEALAIASYNGGPHAVARWMKEGSDLEPDEFIEEIGYTETRRYVKRVLRSYGMYELLYGEGAPLIKMSEKMERAGLVLRGDGGVVKIESLEPGSPDYPDF